MLLLSTYHYWKRDPEELLTAESVYAPTKSVHSSVQRSSNDAQWKGLSPINHRLLQYNNPLDTGSKDTAHYLHRATSTEYLDKDLNGKQQFVLENRYTDDPNDTDTSTGANSVSRYQPPYEQKSIDPFTINSSVSTIRQLSGVSMTSTDATSSSLHTVHKAVQEDSLSPISRGTDLNLDVTPQDIREGKRNSHCDVSGIKSWSEGVVTALNPRIQANCDLMRQNNRQEIERVKKEIESWKSSESEEEWIESLSDCKKVVEDFSNNFYNSPEELDFPLAYILVVYTNPRQMVRLIKALWRPQNLFCIHPDAKQSDQFIGVFRQLSKCLDNVFLPQKLEKVFYQHHTIMDSQLNCYEDLLKYPSNRWRYVINLCGRELPLKTNREMVKSLKKLKGFSAIESKHVQSKGFLTRDRFTWKAEEDYTNGKLHYTRTRLKPPPIPIYKSFNFIAASRQFVNFFVNDNKAIEFRNYLKDVKIPEEEFYASLIHLPGVPGGNPPRHIPVPTIDKYIWMNKNKQTRNKYESCEGRMVHFICIVSVGDLDQIYHWGINRRTPVFFFNKYFMEDDHVVMDCMEERLLHQNMKEYETDCKRTIAA